MFAGTVLCLVGVGVVQAGYQGLLPDRLPPGLRGRGAGAKGLFDVGGAFAAFAILAGILAAGQAALAVGILVIGLVGTVALALALVGGARQPARAVSEDWWQRLRAPGGLTQLILARFLFLLGIYAVGRFLLLFVAERQGLSADAAAGEAGAVLALLTLLTAGSALPAGWLADRIGRRTLMLLGGLTGALGIGLLPLAASSTLLLAFGGLMAIGSAAFGAGSWAMLADLSEGGHAGRLLGIANFGTAGSAAAAGLFGPLIDGVSTAAPGNGYTVAFLAAAALSALGATLAWRLVQPAQSLETVLEVPD
jgi:Major Facilitator Superfamily